MIIHMSQSLLNFPGYHDNRIKGVFVCSLVITDLSRKSIGNAISQLFETGLFNSDSTIFNDISNSFNQEGVYLSDREKEIISILIRGRTANRDCSSDRAISKDG